MATTTLARPALKKEAKARVRRSTIERMKRYKTFYLFALPGLVFFGIFAYVPILGNVIAFQDYRPLRGFLNSDWVGFDNFVALFSDAELGYAVLNTLVISFLQIVFAFPAPIALAIFLNSLISSRLRKSIQTILYLPHFLSWVIVISIWRSILGGTGPVAKIFEAVGIGGVNIMDNPDTFKFLLTSEVIWKDVGWGTIIFFAALLSIPEERYEAAAMDGASSWRRIWHITLPGMLPVITLMLILTIGNVLSVGFEQLYLQQPAVGTRAAQVIDTFVYFRGVAGGDWGFSTAAGLIKGVIATCLVIGANRLSKRLGGEGIL